MILEGILAELTKLPNLVAISVDDDKEITVCGDTHGQYFDLLNIFSMNGNPSVDNPYLMNGDFVDRGSFSVEIIVTLLCWRLVNNKCMYLTRGNHEAKSLNMIYGFKGECEKKYCGRTYDIFCDVFCALPLCFTINKRVYYSILYFYFLLLGVCDSWRIIQ